MEAGVTLSVGSLIEHCLQEQTARKQPQEPVQTSDLTSLAELHAGIAAGARDKAAGQDQLPMDVWKAEPRKFATNLYPLILKANLTCKEPIQHKGGVLSPLWKRKGGQDKVESYRDIVLEDALAKCVHAAARRRLMKAGRARLRATQCGGIKGRGTDMPALLARQFFHVARRSGRSAAALFIDLRDAYYRVLREVVVGGKIDAEVIAALALRLGLPREAAAQLEHAFDGIAREAATGLSEREAAWLQELHGSTWFALENADDVDLTRSGTRPGDPLSDAVFLFFAAVRLEELERRARAAGLLEEADIPWSGRLSVAA